MYKVFIVDDEIIVREGIRNKIDWENSCFIFAGEASDGEIAFSLIKESKPDILITDIKMPFMDGLELSRQVKEILPSIKIIILSGHDEFEYAKTAISLGVEDYILKPFTAEELLFSMNKIAKSLDVQNLIINKDPLSEKLKFATKKESSKIIDEYLSIILESNENFNIASSYLLVDVIIAVAQLVEELGGNIKELMSEILTRDFIDSATENQFTFTEKMNYIFSKVIEYRDSKLSNFIEGKNLGRSTSVILKAKEIIEKNFTNSDLSLISVAEEVNLSPNHFSSIFSQECGITFIEYLTNVRIEEAKKLLRNTNLKSIDISYNVGFNDSHYFSTLFKKITGLTTKEYRQKEKKTFL